MDGFPFTDSDIARFWAKVDRSGGPDACWLWTGTTTGDGYGIFDRRRGGKRQALRCHRVAFTLAGGVIPETEPLLRHTCDTRLCCNSAHLIVGTASQNSTDMVSRGRHWTALHPERVQRGSDHWSRRNPSLVKRGSDHHRALLTTASVAEIRAKYAAGNTSQRELAAEYAVSQALIWKVVTGRGWA